MMWFTIVLSRDVDMWPILAIQSFNQFWIGEMCIWAQPIDEVLRVMGVVNFILFVRGRGQSNLEQIILNY